jgi:hypothetical protein
MDAQRDSENILYISYLRDSWDAAETPWQGYFDNFLTLKSLKNRPAIGIRYFRHRNIALASGAPTTLADPPDRLTPSHSRDEQRTPRPYHQGSGVCDPHEGGNGGALRLRRAGVFSPKEGLRVA